MFFYLLIKTHALICILFIWIFCRFVWRQYEPCVFCAYGLGCAHFLFFRRNLFMDQQKIQMFLITNQKNFEASQIPFITKKLNELNDDQLMVVSTANYKEPTTMLIISLLLGGLGVDRFMLGETGMGVLKLLTAGCLGILTIIDWFNVMSKTRKKNFEIFLQSIEMCKTLSDYSNRTNNIEEIKRIKQLLDSGTISEEEYEQRKKELL